MRDIKFRAWDKEDEGYEEECMYDYADGMEVIGNIYENPELLSQLN